MRVTYSAALIAATVASVATVGAQTPASQPSSSEQSAVQSPAPQSPATQAPATQALPSADPSQTWAASRGRTAADARFKVRVMEGVLERAVEHAATVMNQQLRAVSPDLVLLTGAARARGYRLDGYGLIFEVQVPAALRQSMGWTVRMMRQNNESVEQALTLFKRMVGGLQGRARDEAELALRNIELQVRPGLGPSDSATAANVPPLFSVTPSPAGLPAGFATPASSGSTSTASASSAPASSPTPGPSAPAVESVLATSAPTPDGAVAPTPASSESLSAAAGNATPSAEAPTARTATPINPLVVQNPDLAYELEVREALIGAMVEWGATLPLSPEEWFTVAARDNQDVVIPGEAAEVVTIIMRVRGSDLAEFRAGRLTAADVRKRVEVREF